MSKSKTPGDYWRTPKPVFLTLDKEFEFVADMACNEDNKLCPIGFTESMDSLSLDWDEEIAKVSPFRTHKYVWLNPPYSNPMPWVKKALESQLNGLGVVMLLNADHSVGWFYEALKGVSEIRNIIADEDHETWRAHTTGRIAFTNEEGKPISGNNKPQFVLVFNPFKVAARETTYIQKSTLYK